MAFKGAEAFGTVAMQVDEDKVQLGGFRKMARAMSKTKGVAAFSGGPTAVEKAAEGMLRRGSKTYSDIGGGSEGDEASQVQFFMQQAEARLKELEKATRVAEEAEFELSRDHIEKALKLAEQALKTDSASVKALRVAAKVHIKKKMWAAALRETKELVSQEAPHEMDFTDRAEARIGARDFQGAKGDCVAALKINRLYVRAMYQRARAKYYLHEYDDCIEECTECINIDSRNPYYWSLRAMAKQGLYNNSGAIQDCNEAIRIDYKHAPAWSTRGDARNDLEDHAGAIKDINIALRLEKSDARVWSNGADAHEALEHYQDAVDFATEAIELDPHLYDGFGRRGEARFGLGDLKGAIEDCGEAVRLNRLDKDAWYCSARAKFIRGDYKGSRHDARGALSADPEYEGCDTVIHQTKEAERVLKTWETPPLITEYRAKMAAGTRGVVPSSASRTQLVRVGSTVATWRGGSKGKPALLDVPRQMQKSRSSA